MDEFLVLPGIIKTLGLSTTERIALSVVYNFCQSEQGLFYGSYQYIADWIGCNRRNAIRIMARLEEAKWIEKKTIIKDEKSQNAYVLGAAWDEGCHKDTSVTTTPSLVSLRHPTSVATTPNNKEIININNKNISTTPPRTHTCEEIIEEISASFLSELEQCKADYPYEMIEEFKDYWLAKLLQPKPKNKIYLRFQTEKTFSMRGRLRTWARIAESRRQEQAARMPRSHSPTAQSFAEAEKSFRRIAERQAETLKAEEKLRLLNEKYIDDQR